MAARNLPNAKRRYKPGSEWLCSFWCGSTSNDLTRVMFTSPVLWSCALRWRNLPAARTSQPIPRALIAGRISG
jgi:hypothetical protein